MTPIILLECMLQYFVYHNSVLDKKDITFGYDAFQIFILLHCKYAILEKRNIYKEYSRI